MRSSPCRALAATLALAMVLPAFPVFAQDKRPVPTQPMRNEASTRFKKGLELFNDGDYRAALIEFRRANELAPNYQVLYNIGQVSFELQDYASALTAFQAYLDEGGTRIAAKRRAEVDKDIEKLKTRIAFVVVTANVEGATVAIDDAEIGRTPLDGPVLVSAGRRKITVSREGRPPVSKVLEIASGDAPEVSFDLEDSAAPTSADPPLAPVASTSTPAASLAESTSGGPHTSSWVLPAWIATGALTAGAVVMGSLSLGASSDLKSVRESAAPKREELDRLSTKTGHFALATDILAGAAIVAGGVSLYLTLSGGSADKPKAATAVRVGVNPGGLALRGAF